MTETNDSIGAVKSRDVRSNVTVIKLQPSRFGKYEIFTAIRYLLRLSNDRLKLIFVFNL